MEDEIAGLRSLLTFCIFISLTSSYRFDLFSWGVLAFGVGEMIACHDEWFGFVVFPAYVAAFTLDTHHTSAEFSYFVRH